MTRVSGSGKKPYIPQKKSHKESSPLPGDSAWQGRKLKKKKNSSKKLKVQDNTSSGKPQRKTTRFKHPLNKLPATSNTSHQCKGIAEKHKERAAWHQECVAMDSKSANRLLKEEFQQLKKMETPLLVQTERFMTLYCCQLLKDELTPETLEMVDRVGEYLSESDLGPAALNLRHDILLRLMHQIHQDKGIDYLTDKLLSLHDNDNIPSNSRIAVQSIFRTLLSPCSALESALPITTFNVNGHSRNVMTANDWNLLKALCKNDDFSIQFIAGVGLPQLDDDDDRADIAALDRYIQEDLQRSASEAGLNELHDELIALDISRVKELLARPSTGAEEQKELDKALAVICRGRKALLDIQLDAGARWDKSIMQQRELWSDERHYHAVMKLFDIDSLRSPRIDHAQLISLREEHNRHPLHPKVAIEGAGPTGLMAAITQFQSGGDVAVYEARNTQYERTQVLLLDPKWMNMLKFYLGEKFYDLLDHASPVETLGIEGFGKVVTKRLEDALHQRFSELNSLVNDDDKLSRRALYTLKKLEEPGKEGEKYKTVAVFNKEKAQINTPDKSNPALSLEPQPGEERLTQEVDILICAGGKNSAMLKDHLSIIPRPGEGFYGVASWESATQIKNDDLQTFEDFRNRLVCNKTFLKTLQNRFSSAMGPESPLYSAMPDKAHEEALSALNLEIKDIASEIEDTFLRTRTFERRGLVYIGMEMPEPVKAMLARLREKLQGQTPSRAEDILKVFSQVWFSAVADYYDLGRIGVNDEVMDRKFTSTFPLSQHNLQEGARLKSQGDTHVLITAAGDAKASPHFMRYSGLTGARENVLALAQVTEQWSKAPLSEEEREKVLDELGDKDRVIDSFIINAGSFLLRSTPGKLKL